MTAASGEPAAGEHPETTEIRLKFFTVDVFTTRRFAGNPLAIVEDADGLDDETMQAIAREFNLSETIFVQAPADPANTARVRIFFPTAEIPFAGHPTIGCAIHLAAKRHPDGSDFATRIVLEEAAGLVPVDVERRDGVATAQFTAPVLPHAHDGEVPSPEQAAAALGLAPEDIGFGSTAIGLYAGGPAYLYVRLASRPTLAQARPCEPQWSRMTAAANVDAAYVYTPGGEAAETDFSARMFSPASGILEDPATGSATAILAGPLLAAGSLEEGTNRFRLEQGCDMGRPSQLGLEIDVVGQALTAVRISGSSVRVSAGELILD
ncbi:MAG: isomerase [Alphaproteobacteria bacterium]|nr:MAG: isomerase [Alphaproteobacteria bacterium]